jgi:hypothetical protein
MKKNNVVTMKGKKMTEGKEENTQEVVEPKLITLVLTVDEVNLALDALAAGPYVRVADLIGKIRGQAIPQVTPTTPVE